MVWKDKGIYAVMIVVLAIFAYMNYRYLDIQFLDATSGDELPQFHQLKNMLEGFKNFNIEEIFRFGFYNYGFGWYLINLMAVFPFHMLDDTQMAIYVPRVLNGIFSAFCLLVFYKIAKIYLSAWYAYGIVLMVVLMPGFWEYGYLFKPDVFQALLVLISVFLLALDKFNFSRFYYIGVIVFGLAVGVAKFQAIMFMPMFYAYIFLGCFENTKKFFFKKFLVQCLGISIGIVLIWLFTNPYLFHPRGMGAWWDMFLLNMHSNATNHGHYNHISLSDKIFKVIDFYFLEVVVFGVLICISLGLFFYFFSILKKKEFDKELNLFVVIAIGFLISLLYLLFFVNKTWGNYYITTIYLGVLLLIPLFKNLKLSKYILFPLFILQIAGGGGQP